MGWPEHESLQPYWFFSNCTEMLEIYTDRLMNSTGEPLMMASSCGHFNNTNCVTCISGEVSNRGVDNFLNI